MVQGLLCGDGEVDGEVEFVDEIVQSSVLMLEVCLLSAAESCSSIFVAAYAAWCFCIVTTLISYNVI